jgi:hypothetical protein
MTRAVLVPVGGRRGPARGPAAALPRVTPESHSNTATVSSSSNIKNFD